MHNLHFIFLTHLYLKKKNQDHQTYNENIDPKQGYKHAEFERSRFNGVREKTGFLQMRKYDLSPLHICENKK